MGYPRHGLNRVSPEEAMRGMSLAIASFSCFRRDKNAKTGKGQAGDGWALVAAIGLVGFYSRTANSGALEDQQKAAGAIVTQAKELANVQAERSRVAREAEKRRSLSEL